MTALRAIEQYDGTQDSGIEWLGEIPAHWQLKRLKFVVDIEKRIAGKEGFDVLSITQKGIKVKDVESGEGQLAMDYSKYQFLYKGEFAMNHMDLLTGYVDISQYDGVVSPDYRVFRNRSSEVLDAYLLLIFQIGYTQRIFYKYGQGVSFLGRWRLPADSFNNFYIPIPSLKEQQQIVEFVNRKTKFIDDAISIMGEQIALLRERKQIIIQRAVTQGLNSSAPMKDSAIEWIGKIPKNWNVVRLKYLLADPLKYGANESGIEYSPDLPRYIRITDFSGDGKLSEDKKLSLPWNVGKHYLLEDGDILLARSGATVGKSYQFKALMATNENCCFAGYLIRARANASEIKADYLNIYLNSNCFTSWKNSIFNKATIENIGADKYSILPVVVPPLDEQLELLNAIGEKTMPLDRAVSQHEEQIAKLREYKETLISSAVTGKVKVA